MIPVARVVRDVSLVPLLLVALLSGCGGQTAPSEAVPALADRLERVDAAIAAGNHDRTRDAVEALVAETTRAQDAGELSPDQADPVLDAAGRLLAQLPGDAPSEQPTRPTPTEPTAGDGDDGTKDDEDDEDDEDDDKGKDEDEDGKDGKDGKDDSEGNGGGNGPSSGNGPDDGHGN